MTRSSDETFMALALRQARRGLGRTSPNPSVGALLVKNGTVVGQGYHHRAGSPHAEIHALRDAGGEARGATLYVTLEPCNHTGRTPPCSHALVEAGIARVVIGTLDPNPLVDGSGADYLRHSGVAVTAPVLEEQCRELILPFIKTVTSGLPWVLMKAGLSLDGKLAFRHGERGAMTGGESLKIVHRLRNELDGILVGIETVLVDNPSLTTRLPRGRGRDPVRIILDSRLRIPEKARVLSLDSRAPTWIFCGTESDPATAERLRRRGVQVYRVASDESGLNLRQVLRRLVENGLCSVMVEGGGRVHGSFLRARLVDRAMLFYAPVFAGAQAPSLLSGIAAVPGGAQAIRLAAPRVRRFGEDFMLVGEVLYPGGFPAPV